MASLVTAELGTKENPHPEEFKSMSVEERKKYKGHWVIYNNGLRKINAAGGLTKASRNQSKTFNGYTQSGFKLNFKICLQRLESVGCKLLHDEKEFNEIYKNTGSIIKLQYNCGCEQEDKWSCVWEKIKRWQQKKEMFNNNDNTNNINHSLTKVVKLYHNNNGMNCKKCSSLKTSFEKYNKDNFNEQTNQYRCIKCRQWKDKDIHYSNNYHTIRIHGALSCCCIDCKKEKLQKYWNNLTFNQCCQLLLKNCRNAHRQRKKRGRFKKDSRVTIKKADILECRDTQNNICVFTGEEMEWKRGGVDNQVSIDRIEKEETYIKSNIQLCTSKANEMKMDKTDEEFITLCGKIWMYRRGKDGYIDSENEKLKKEIEQLKKNNEQLKERLNNKK